MTPNRIRTEKGLVSFVPVPGFPDRGPGCSIRRVVHKNSAINDILQPGETNRYGDFDAQGEFCRILYDGRVPVHLGREVRTWWCRRISKVIDHGNLVFGGRLLASVVIIPPRYYSTLLALCTN